MPTRGVLMRMYSPKTEKDLQHPAVTSLHVHSQIEATYLFGRDDELTPEYHTLYFLSDIEPIVQDSSFFDADMEKHADETDSLSWVVLSFINGRGKADNGPKAEAHVPLSPPAVGSILVANGSTPTPDKEDDYHAWYDEEHGGKLAQVPGWQLSRRYKLEKSYGDIKTASFYGLNFYDEKNGLGGPEWKAGVTEWTLRIRQQAARPNIRRVWKLLSSGSA